MDKHELTYAELSPQAQRGFRKLAVMSADGMKHANMMFGNQTGKNGYHILNKTSFYTWVDKNYKMR